MATVIDVLRFINIFFAAIATGTLVMVLLALIPMVGSMSPGVGLQVHHRIDPLIDRFNPPSVIISAVAAALILLLDAARTSTTVFLYVVGILGSIGIAVTSLGFNMRINRSIRAWSVDAVPEEYGPTRERWNRFHLVRTVSSVLALSCYIIAVLASR